MLIPACLNNAYNAYKVASTLKHILYIDRGPHTLVGLSAFSAIKRFQPFNVLYAVRWWATSENDRTLTHNVSISFKSRDSEQCQKYDIAFPRLWHYSNDLQHV